MDNDLMARRLRPPSEPVSSMPSTGPMPPPSWMQQAPPEPQMPVEPPMRAEPHMPADTQMPAAREDVPWDRPSDYAQPTDTATSTEPAWDQPDNQAPWDDSAVYDDRTADMFEPRPEPEIYGAMVAAAAASESAVAEAVATFAPTVTQAPTSAVATPTVAWSADPTTDPDDAFAPVLEDVYTVPTTGWHEPIAQAEATRDTQAISDESDDFWAEAWQATPQTTPQPQTSALVPVEPSELAGRGLGPTPPAELFTDAPSLWSAPSADQGAPVNEQTPYGHEPDAAPDEEQTTVAVTAEEAWQAYETFGADQHPEAQFEAPAVEQQPEPQHEAFTTEPQPEAQYEAFTPEPQPETHEAFVTEQEPESQYEVPTSEQQPEAQYEVPTSEQLPEGEYETFVTEHQLAAQYEAFAPMPETEAGSNDVGESAAVLEVEVPHAATTAPSNGEKPQQLVLRIELAIVDGNGHRIDPANVAVRVSHVAAAEAEASPIATGETTAPTASEPETVEASAARPEVEPELSQFAAEAFSTQPEVAPEVQPFTPEASAAQPTVEPELAQPAPAFDEPPWPTEVQSAVDSRLSEAATWLEPTPTFAPSGEPAWPSQPAQMPGQAATPGAVAPAPPQEPAPQPSRPIEPAFATQPPWTKQPPVKDPLSSLSAPPRPASYPAPSQQTSPSFAPPVFAPPTFAPPPPANRVDATASPTNATTSDIAAPAVAGEQREPSFRAPPSADASGDAAAIASTGGTRTALWTLGVGILVVALILVFLRLMTNIF